MNTEHAWDRVRAVFRAALDWAPHERDALLSDACDGDETLRREVESLLAAHAAAGGFLDAPVHRVDTAQAPRQASTLNIGDRLGRFVVTGTLGAGGMGEVYRARDSQLGREVAIKLLPPVFAADPERLARFERESRLLASLKHPNIAAIHDVERVDDLYLLVLELVEGPTLAERVKQGPLPPAEALEIARQLASALAAAHARGIVHRDLKPANVKLTPSGQVTLLDFGLAKAPTDAEAAPALAATRGLETEAGLILGTCAYMSPEQARGQSVDKRADIWAFGCIVFELLTGRPAFGGGTPSDTLAAVIERQPDWQALPEPLPEAVHRLLGRCLEKDPNLRLHDIADARLEIDEALRHAAAGSSAPHAAPAARARKPRRAAARIAAAPGAALLLVAGAAGIGWWARGMAAPGQAPAPAPLARFTWALPAGLALASAPAVSPDGRSLAFTAAPGGGALPQLYVRPLGALEPRPIPRTEGAKNPFWSPDGTSIAYFANAKLMRVAVGGGAPVEICQAPDGLGGTWSPAGVIVFGPRLIDSGLMRVPAHGGTPEPVTVLDAARGDNSHRWPVFLPDGRHFLYFVRSVVQERRGVYLGSVDGQASAAAEPLFRSESEALFAPVDGGRRGVVFNVAEEHVDARLFDTNHLAIAGDPVRLDLPAGGNTPHHAAMLSVSADTLVHVAAPMPYGSRLMSVSRSGSDLRQDPFAGIINWPRLSPDGSRLALQFLDPLAGSPDIWVTDVRRGARVRITRPGMPGLLPVWSPDGAYMAYAAGTLKEPRLVIARADGTGEAAALACPAFRCEPSDWSPDGRWIVVNALDDSMSAGDVWMVPAGSAGTPRPLFTGPFVERDARMSPDASLMAYVSEETGRPEISIRSLDGAPRREVVSAGGGSQPVWARDGRELLFVDPEGILRAVPVRRAADGRLVLGAAAPAGVPPLGLGHYGTQYDLSPDGKRVYFLDRRTADPPRELGIVLGWRALIK